MKYENSKMKIISIKQDILTLSVSGINGEEGWGNLDFGGAKNAPLADLANILADKL